MDSDATATTMGDAATAEAGRRRVSTACEACRATKVRCRPSALTGVCQKTSSSSSSSISSPPQPILPPPGLSSTFTIDFAIPARPKLDDSIDLLRDAHEECIDDYFPDDDTVPIPTSFPDQQPTQEKACVPAVPLALAAQPGEVPDRGGQAQPLFNLASAEALLASFRRDKLSRLPCVHIPAEATVSQLAASQPFVLLAILAASSGSTALQGHSLYDDEFRRVLGQNYVAGSEPSLELLQGILIYSAWYPIHLRPKDKQGFKYLRMAADLIDDLDLASPPSSATNSAVLPPTEQQLDGIRAYLTYVHLTTTYCATWKTSPQIPPRCTANTAANCDWLRQNARVPGDVMLATLCRTSCLLHEAYQATHEFGNSGQPPHHRWLVLEGLAAQLAAHRASVPPAVACSDSTPTLFSAEAEAFSLQCDFVAVYLDSGLLMKYPRAGLTRRRRPRNGATNTTTAAADDDSHPLQLPLDKARACVPKLATLLTGIAALEDASLPCLNLDDWGRLILGVMLAMRLSFATPECPGLDAAWVRSQLRLDCFLNHMARSSEDNDSNPSPTPVPPPTQTTATTTSTGTGTGTRTGTKHPPAIPPPKHRHDMRGATRVIMSIVAAKYRRRLDAAEKALALPRERPNGCPMFDAFLEPYLPLWEAWPDCGAGGAGGGGQMTMPMPEGVPVEGGVQGLGGDCVPAPMFDYLWTTMTTAWADGASAGAGGVANGAAGEAWF